MFALGRRGGFLHVRTHCKSHCFAGQRSDVGRLRGLSTGNTSRPVGPPMLGRLPTTAVLPAPARISTAAGCASIRAATWTAAETVIGQQLRARRAKGRRQLDFQNGPVTSETGKARRRKGNDVPTFLFRCPNTGYRVQGFVAEEDFSDDAEDYQAVTCLACKRTHHCEPNDGQGSGRGKPKPKPL
jgi:hypothetical protein